MERGQVAAAGAASRLGETAKAVPAADISGHRIVIVDASRTQTIDDSGSATIAELLRVAQQGGQLVVIVTSLAPNVGGMLRAMFEFDGVPDTHFAVDQEAGYAIARRELLKLGQVPLR